MAFRTLPDMKEMVRVLPTKIQRLYFGLLALGYSNSFSIDTKQHMPKLPAFNTNNPSSLTVMPITETHREYTFEGNDMKMIYNDNNNLITKELNGTTFSRLSFSKDELRLFDTLGIEINSRLQDVDDWWNMK